MRTFLNLLAVLQPEYCKQLYNGLEYCQEFIAVLNYACMEPMKNILITSAETVFLYVYR